MKQTCYYELLQVDPNATQEDIKRSYRKRALQLHPDKNYDRIEEATREFSLLQQAYEVLSDPQERAWYDSHKEAILRGDDMDSSIGSDDPGTSVASLMSYFIASCYKGYDDNETGFFAVYRKLFATLANEELAVDDEYTVDDDIATAMDPGLFVSFGTSRTPFVRGAGTFDERDSLKNFYASWQSFSTRKSFRWKDKWRLSEAPDRRHRRAMEKENKKARLDARREYSDTVKQLAGFIRKRDPRVKAHIETIRIEQEKRDNERKAQESRDRADRLAAASAYEVPEWAKVPTEHHDFSHSNAEEDDNEEFYCVACEKRFRSDRQYMNHEKSKKHQKQVEELRRLMLEEDFEIERQSSFKGPDASGTNCHVNEEECDEVPCSDSEMIGETCENNRSDTLNEGPGASDVNCHVNEEQEECGEVPCSESEMIGETCETNGIDMLNEVYIARSKDGKPSPAEIDPQSSIKVDRPAQTGTKTKERQNEHNVTDATGTQIDAQELAYVFTDVNLTKDTVSEDPYSSAESEKVEREILPVYNEGGNAQMETSAHVRIRKKQNQGSVSSSSYICNVCKEEFATRNKLFSHIKASGHALAVPAEASNSENHGAGKKLSGKAMKAMRAAAKAVKAAAAAEKGDTSSEDDWRVRKKGKKGKRK